MTDVSGSGGEGGIEGLPPGGTAIGAITVDDLTGLVLELQSASDAEIAEAMLREIGPSYEMSQVGDGRLVVAGLLTALATAYKAGSVIPRDTAQALGWVLSKLGLKAFDKASIQSGDVAKALARYGAESKSPPKAKPVPKAKPASPGVSVGGESEGTRTIGGRMVGEAQRGIRRATVSAPGLDKTEAQAISLAIARSYGDVMHTLIAVTNAIEGQLAALVTRLDTLAGDHATTTARAPTIPPALATELAMTTTRITNLEHALEHTLELVDAADATAKAAASQPETQAVKALGFEVTGISATLAAIRAGQGSLATKASVDALASDLQVFEESPPIALLETQTGFMRSLPNTIKTLEDCCAENRAVTRPLSSLAKDASLLSKLKEMATVAFAAFIVGGIIEVITMLFDAPAVIAGTVRGAAWVAPYAENAALSTANDVDWADTVAAAS